MKALASTIPNVKIFTASVLGRGNENTLCDVRLGGSSWESNLGGKWKTLKYGNEVWKPKYGSERKSHLSVSSALLTHDCAL